jgi:type II secretory pathway pseudopilin PulG
MRPQITRDEGHSAVEAAPNSFGAAIIQHAQATRVPLQSRSRLGFTLAELLVSLGVLVLLVLLFTQLLNSATRIATLGHKQMDADSQAREVLDRMAIDFAQMVKRSDVDYYLKSPSTPQSGNDQIAFYAAVPGYYPTVPAPAPTYTQKSPLSLVSYRINSDTSNSASASYNRMERMGKGLA